MSAKLFVGNLSFKITENDLQDAFAVICGLMVFQATRAGAAPVLMPSEVIAQGADAALPRLRVAGRVSTQPEVAYVTSPQIRLSFNVEDPKHPEKGSIPVVYNGLRPDMFASGRDVIIDGEFKGGTLTASSLLTQCPSKYEAPDPEKRYKTAMEHTQ